MRTTLLAFSCLFVITSFAQDSSFQIKDYKYRTPRFRALVLSTNLSGDISRRSHASSDSSLENHFQLFPTSLFYNQFVSTDEKFSFSSLSLGTTYSYASRNANYNRKESGGNGGVEWKFENRYFRKKNWFWQVGNDASVKGSFFKQTIYPINSREADASDALKLGFGKGRIEMVQDAQMALYILKDLKAEGLIEGEVDSSTIYEFARLITAINNKRVFDSRRKRIYELTKIDSFLRRNGVAKETDIRYFTIINDDWSFAYNPDRSSGKDWFFHLVPSVQYSKSKWRTKTTGTDMALTSYGLMPEIGVERYKPLSLKWQSNFLSTLSWARNSYKSKMTQFYPGATPFETKGSQDFNETQLDIFYRIGYYPSTRTNVNSGFGLTASYFSFQNSYSKDRLLLNPSFVFLGDYFISYRTRLTVNLTTDYQYNHINWSPGGSSNSCEFHLSFNAGLTHAFL